MVAEKQVDNAFHAGIKPGDTVMNTGFSSNYQYAGVAASGHDGWVLRVVEHTEP